VLILDVTRALDDAGVSFAVVGGYGVALHGAVRGTVDLDLVLAYDEANYIAAASALESLGLRSRLPVLARDVFRFRREYVENRNLIAWSFVDERDPSRLVDIVLTFTEPEVPTTKKTVRGVRVPVLAKAALIEMKERSGRPQDLEDVRALKSIR